MAILMRLKEKYRQPGRLRKDTQHFNDPPEGTMIFKIGISRTKTGGNSGHAQHKGASIRPRRKAYGPF